MSPLLPIPTARVLLAILSLAALFAGCEDPEMRYRILAAAFDGVPPPGATPEPRRARRMRRQFPNRAVAEAPTPTPTPEPRGLPIEKVHTIEDAVPLLPTDVGGGPDWVMAVRMGTVKPRHAASPENGERAPLPFPLEVELDPEDPRFSPFKVLFPHFAHTLWLTCVNCHPGIFQMKRGANPITMSKVWGGEYCGRCHGKVAFAPETRCARCHVRLRSVDAEAIRAEVERGAQAPIPASMQLLQRGKAAYKSFCAMCHGEKGDGQGPAAPALDPKPRDFTKGKYKFRTTQSTSIPADFDVFRTITVGVPGTAMPSWAILSNEDRWGLAYYVKTFSDRFEKERPGESLQVPEPPAETAELLAEGRKLYLEAGCNACHGHYGRGDGALNLQDDWGFPIRPFNFTGVKPYKSGPTPRDIYRSAMTGLTGTPMPSFGDVLEPAQAWAVVLYVRSLSRQEAPAGAPLAETAPILFLPGPKEIAADLSRAAKDPLPMTLELIETGEHVYQQQCAVCHGERGDGEGTAAANLDPKPRDFTKGKYKFRATPSSSVPTDFDVFRSITVGMPATAMPPWAILPYEERWALVHFLKTLSDRFEKEQPAPALDIPEPPQETPELLAEGRQLYMDGGCNACHGDEGRGDGGAASALQDDWGNPIRPFPFSSDKPYKSGPAPQDVYRSVMTGLTGTPMPSFGDIFEPAQAWSVVLYVRSLGKTASSARVEEWVRP